MRTKLIFGLSSLLALGLAACGSSDGNDDAGITTIPDAYIPPPVIDAYVAIDTAVADPYIWVVVQDTEQKACKTNGPGADIDAVAIVNAAGVPTNYGKLLSATYTANPLGNACENAECNGANCKYAAIGGVFPVATLEMYTEGPKDAVVNAATNDSGYFALNGGTLQLQMGDATGGGAAVTLKKGDMIKVFEVDQAYVTATNGCACQPEHFTVSLQTAGGTYLALKPTVIDTVLNPTCTAATAASVEGCGTTVFMVP